MLSNVATPIYYGRFRDQVMRGEIPVNETISLEMQRIDDLIDDPRYYYDDKAVEGYIKFCENELTLTDGADLNLLESFKLWAEEIWGWYYFTKEPVYIPPKNGKKGHYEVRKVKKRLTKIQYLIVARGAAKSMYASTIQNYGLNVDPQTTHQVTTAPTMRQAEEVLSPIRTAITRARGPLFKFLTIGSIQNTTGNRNMRQKLASTKKGIENFLTGSLLEIRPMTTDKLQGLQPKYSSVDEWLSGDIKEDVVGPLVQGGGKLKDYLILAISSEGCVRNGVGDTIKLELMDILKGDYYAPHISIWYYKLDDIKEVEYGKKNPDIWLKANPNLGKTVSFEEYLKDVERAEKVPAAKNDILAKRFGIPTEGYTYFFTYAETLVHDAKREYWKMSCSLGCDLSQGDDFCAFTFLFPLPKEEFGIKTRSYITSRTLYKLPSSTRIKYQEFMDEGSLVVMDTTILDMMDVYDDLMAYIEDHEYDVCSLGYDPYNAKDFIERWEKEQGPYGIVKVPQGTKTESVPLGEIKDLAEDRLLIFDQQLMQFAMGNCISLEDNNGNRKLYKKRFDEKIDNVAALLDAWVAYKMNKENFI